MRKYLAGALLAAGLLAVPTAAAADDSVRITGDETGSVRITGDETGSVRITGDGTDREHILGTGDGTDREHIMAPGAS